MALGAGREIITAMQQYREVAELQKYACRAFRCLAEDNDDNRVSLMELGAEREIITAMQQHRAVAEEACAALENLASNADKN